MPGGCCESGSLIACALRRALPRRGAVRSVARWQKRRRAYGAMAYTFLCVFYRYVQQLELDRRMTAVRCRVLLLDCASILMRHETAFDTVHHSFIIYDTAKSGVDYVPHSSPLL